MKNRIPRKKKKQIKTAKRKWFAEMLRAVYKFHKENPDYHNKKLNSEMINFINSAKNNSL